MKLLSALVSARSKTILLGSLALAAAVWIAPAARADTYAFNVSGSGITASGLINVTLTGPNGAYSITGISGNFSDSNNSFHGTITGLSALAGPIVLNTAPDPAGTFAPPSLPGAFSYDNLFYPAGDAYAVCKDALAFFGGVFDVYGLSFTVAGVGNVDSVDIWSNGPSMGGYVVGDAYKGTKLSPAGDGNGYFVGLSTSPVPEPGSLLLIGTGLPGVVAVWKRKRNA